MNKQQNIKHISILENQTILINFSQDWDQDDSAQLADIVLANIEGAKLLEQTHGADRQYFRFLFANNYFILHFEHYSYSCWIEADDEVSAQFIEELFKQINN